MSRAINNKASRNMKATGIRFNKAGARVMAGSVLVGGILSSRASAPEVLPRPDAPFNGKIAPTPAQSEDHP